MTILKCKILDQSYELDSADLPEASREFLLAYGYKQYIADGAAVSKFDSDGTELTDDEMEAAKVEGADKRFANVQSGDFTRTASRDPVEVETRRVAQAWLRAECKARKLKYPDGKANKAAREALWAQIEKSPKWAEFVATAEVNIAKAAELASGGFDLGAILK